MRSSLQATDSAGNSIIVDTNQVKLNAAATNMRVAVYLDKELNRGNTQPDFINFHYIKLDPKDREELENIFLIEKLKQINSKKIKEKEFRLNRKNRTIAIESLA